MSTMTERSTLSGRNPMKDVGVTIIPESRQTTTTTRSSPSSRDVLLVQASSEDSGDGTALTGDLRKSVSILAIAPTKMQLPSEVAGATVFVGTGGSSCIASANRPANEPAIWKRTSVPEVQTVNGYGTKHQDQQKELKQQLHVATPVLGQSQLQHHQQSSQTRQPGQHVVKIRINPELDTGRVISTVRLNPDSTDERCASSVKSIVEKSINDNNGTIGDKDNAIDESLWTRRDSVAQLSGHKIPNEPISQTESCVRISVVSGNVNNELIDNQPENSHKNPQHHRTLTPQSPNSRDQARQTDEMIQQRATTNESINATSINRGSACFYYGSFPNSLTTMMISSGQYSPSDTLDSGTCSDLDGTPPPLPKKKNSSTVLLGVSAGNASPVIGGGKGLAGQQQQQHNRAGSVTSSGPELDSDDNESNISCDSLNSGELASRIVEHQSVRVNGIAVVSVDDKITKPESHEQKEENSHDIVGDKLVISGNGSNVKVVSAEHECNDVNDNNNHSNDNKNNNTNKNNNNNNNNNNININNNKIENSISVNGTKSTVDEEMNERNNGNVGASNATTLPAEVILASSSSSTKGTSPSVSPSPSGASSLSKASSTPRVRSPVSNGHGSSPLVASPMVKECTYEERNREQNRIDEENAAADYYANYNRKNGTKYLYDDDRFYKFHINENQSENDKNDDDDDARIDDKESEEFFAGYKILDREAIRSAKGTVRGVKNRVRAGIATFLQKPSTKNYKMKDEGKIVVYTTSMSIVRETYFACIKMLQMLKTHMVKHEVRDMFMSRELQTELKERIGCETIEVPQLFIDGQYIGNADTVERLNETGELRHMFKPYKSPGTCTTCVICGGCRLLPCRVCNGSKKSPVRNDFMKDFYRLRCMNCDEVGLVRCKHC